MTPGRGRGPTSCDLPDTIPVSIDRRRFLLLAGGVTAYWVLRPHVSWAKHAAIPPTTLQPWVLPQESSGTTVDISRSLIGAAILAPSHWNTQPWRFESEGQVIRIVVDRQRALPQIDPDGRSLYLSVGAALENLLIAARAYGLRPTVLSLPRDAAQGVAAEVTWKMGEPARDRTLFSAITDRRTNRQDFDGRAIFLQNRTLLMAQISDEFRLHWIDDRDRLRAVADIVHDAVVQRMRNTRAQQEQYAWMRFGRDEAERRGDGVTVDALEMSGPAHWFAGRYFNPKSWFFRFGASSAAKQARTQVRTAGAVALLTAPRGGPAQWLAAGQAFERLALKATALGIAHQPINEPLEVPRGRADLLRAFSAAGEEPLMLVRFGHCKQPPPSVRRGVALVASFKTT